MALLEFLNKIVDAFEKDSFVMGIFIDLSKAFDTINHEILLTLTYLGGGAIMAPPVVFFNSASIPLKISRSSFMTFSPRVSRTF